MVPEKHESGITFIDEYGRAWKALLAGNWYYYTTSENYFLKLAAALSLMLGCILSLICGIAGLGVFVIGGIAGLGIGFALGRLLGYLIVFGLPLVIIAFIVINFSQF